MGQTGLDSSSSSSSSSSSYNHNSSENDEPITIMTVKPLREAVVE
jgi:hypothetical protein